MDNFERISIYVPKNKQKAQPMERLYKLAQDRDRSLNFMVIEAIAEYVKREERKQK